MSETHSTPPATGSGRRWAHNAWQVLKTVQARLRFFVILALVGGTLASWDWIRAVFEHWTRPDPAQTLASSGLEFWCPMHPTIVRDEPDKCPICGMPLSKRKKGEGDSGGPLPPGIVSRVQLTPYRVALAGIETVPVHYRPLTKTIRTVGFVEFDESRLARITARVTGKSRIDKMHVDITGQTIHENDPLVELYSPDLVVTVENLLDAQRANNPDLLRMARERLKLWGIGDDEVAAILKSGKPITHVTLRAPVRNGAHWHVLRKYQVEGDYVEEGARLYDLADLSMVWIEAQVYEDELSFLKEGMEVQATTTAYPELVFRGKVSFIHPHLDAASRTLKVRFNMENPKHELRPGMYANVELSVPLSREGTLTRVLNEDWRNLTAVDVLRRWQDPGLLGVEPLTRAALDRLLLQRDLVLAIPERAVIDTGRNKFVYRQAGPDVYEGVEVELGPRCGGFHPVLRGLDPGDVVAGHGSFLIDAETRLSAGAASTYFGASGGPQDQAGAAAAQARPSMIESDEAKIQNVLAELSSVDRRLAREQRLCPVLRSTRLGSMGKPYKIFIQGEAAFLCCDGCRKKALEDPARTARALQELRQAARKNQHPN
ncbi:MAG: efflux RND transporter periplasmic adaptor subunit [Gemmataceae bacterium]